MDLKAFTRAQSDLAAAQEKFLQMKAANNLKQTSMLWSEFFILIQRVFTKLRKATEKGPSKGWFDNIVNLRSRDDLLRLSDACQKRR
jgi:hypothetical protein